VPIVLKSVGHVGLFRGYFSYLLRRNKQRNNHTNKEEDKGVNKEGAREGERTKERKQNKRRQKIPVIFTFMSI
jgi:hypothetical protein